MPRRRALEVGGGVARGAFLRQRTCRQQQQAQQPCRTPPCCHTPNPTRLQLQDRIVPLRRLHARVRQRLQHTQQGVGGWLAGGLWWGARQQAAAPARPGKRRPPPQVQPEHSTPANQQPNRWGLAWIRSVAVSPPKHSTPALPTHKKKKAKLAWIRSVAASSRYVASSCSSVVCSRCSSISLARPAGRREGRKERGGGEAHAVGGGRVGGSSGQALGI